jgi:hypothetical protein
VGLFRWTSSQSPITLQKYLYANANPVMGVDPSGLYSPLADHEMATKLDSELQASQAVSAVTIKTGWTAKQAFLVGFAYGVYHSTSTTSQNTPTPPVFIIGSNEKEIYEHVDRYFGQYNNHNVFHRQSPEHNRAWLRTSKASGKCGAVYGQAVTGGGTGKQCDEFPMAAMIEGGEANFDGGRVSLRAANSAQNGSVGSHLRWFYERCKIPPNDSSTNGAFFVRLGDGPTRYECGKN